jgi:hypothetical protein
MAIQMATERMVGPFLFCTYGALTRDLSVMVDLMKPAFLLVGGAGFEPATPGV